VVTLGPSKFSHVRDSAVRMMAQTLDQVIAAGFKRFAVLLGESELKAEKRARLGAVLVAREESKDQDVTIDYHRFELTDPEAPQAQKRWLRARRPDAVVAFPGGHLYRLQGAGYRLPDDVAYFGCPVPKAEADKARPLPGLQISRADYHQAAVELLSELLRLRLFGRPPTPLVRVMDGAWCP